MLATARLGLAQGHCEHPLHCMRGVTLCCHSLISAWGPCVTTLGPQTRPHPILEGMMSDAAGEGPPGRP